MAENNFCFVSQRNTNKYGSVHFQNMDFSKSQEALNSATLEKRFSKPRVTTGAVNQNRTRVNQYGFIPAAHLADKHPWTAKGEKQALIKHDFYGSF